MVRNQGMTFFARAGVVKHAVFYVRNDLVRLTRLFRGRTMASILDLARRAAAALPEQKPDSVSEPEREISELSEISPIPHGKREIPPNEHCEKRWVGQLFNGWVLIRVYHWQPIIRRQTEINARANLADYVEAMGEGVLDSMILPEGQSP